MALNKNQMKTETKKYDKDTKNIIKCLFYISKLIDADSRFRTAKFNFWNRAISNTQGQRDMRWKRECVTQSKTKENMNFY